MPAEEADKDGQREKAGREPEGVGDSAPAVYDERTSAGALARRTRRRAVAPARRRGPPARGGGLPVWVSVLAVGGLLTGAAAVAGPGGACVRDPLPPRRPAAARGCTPVAWWVWALGLATAASFTLNPLCCCC